MTRRVAVLASGGGSNLQALIDWPRKTGVWEIALVVSNRPDAGALERAGRAGIPTEVLGRGEGPVGAPGEKERGAAREAPRGASPGASDGGAEDAPEDPPEDPPADPLLALVRRNGIDVILLAGYLRLVPSVVVAEYGGRILNIHPALLPAFGGPGMYGRRVHAAVLASGATVSGATVHEVDEELDRGRILAQWPVPVLPDDDPGALAARVLETEHLLYPRVADAVIRRMAGGPDASVPFSFRPPGDRFTAVASSGVPVAAMMDAALSIVHPPSPEAGS